LEPCAAGFRPTRDPFVSYDFELIPHLKTNSIAQLMAERALQSINPKHINSTTLHEYYRDLFKEGGMAEEASRGYADKYVGIDRAAIRVLRQFTEKQVITPAVIEALMLKQRTRAVNDYLLDHSPERNDINDWVKYQQKGRITFAGEDEFGEGRGAMFR